MTRLIAVLLAVILAATALPAQAAPNRITVIVDAFGADRSLAKDWGYAALVEYDGRRILFDTGNDEAHFLANAKRLGIALDHLDAVVVSHRHGDHTAGLRRVLALNPGIRVFVPDDEAFLDTTPPPFFAHPDPSLPAAQRYFDGAVPARVPHGTAWPGANFVRVDARMDVAPGVHAVRAIAPAGPFADTPEVSLVLDTPSGQVVLVGCAHPGIETVLAQVAQVDPHVAMVVGGLHLVTLERPAVDALATRLHGQWGVARIAPGHCSGEFAFAALKGLFGSGYVAAGVGSHIPLAPG